MRLLLGILLAWGCVAGAEAQPQTIGVLAFQGREEAINRWQPTADYLSAAIPSADFHVQPLSHEEFIHAINKGELDFVLTNPAHFAQLNVRFGVSGIATFVAKPFDKPVTRFAAVLFTGGDSDIRSLSDLRGRRLAAVSSEAFGGYLLGRKALLESGVDTERDLEVVWMGFPHTDVAAAVLEGKADAGVVRSGVLEEMAAKGQLDLARLRILARRDNDGFPLLHSTALYPEWPFARLPATDVRLSQQVALALMNMPADHGAARRANGAGWTIPLSNTSVHEVLRLLKVAPYLPAELTPAQVLKTYGHWLAIAVALLLFGLVAGARLVRSNARLRATQGLLQKAQGELEEAVRMRTTELERAREELHGTVMRHAAVRDDVDSACSAMHTLYDILQREGLSSQQRIDAMVEVVRHQLGCEVGLLYRVRDHQYQVRSVSPASAPVVAPLDPEAVTQAISQRRVQRRNNGAGHWPRHIACPVFVQGEPHCMLEFASATPAVRLPEGPSELGHVLLGLTAEWIAHEVQLDERHTSESAQLESARARFATVTWRERDVLRLLVQGESNKAIARSLGLSPKTVEMHRANLIRKTSAKSSIELVQLAVSARLFSEIQ